MMTRIPFVNLNRQYERIRGDVDAVLSDVLARQNFINGPLSKAFAQNFNAAIGSPYGHGCSNGTAAISLALEALGVGPGDEVVTVAHTFIATIEAIYHVGATPVFVDIDPDTYTMDVAKIVVTDRTRAIMPVHIYGNMANMDAIIALAKKHDLLVIEDSAQAHLATYKGRYAGTIGDAGTFSFYPGKNLGAYGDAGFVTTRSEAVSARLARLIDHGRLSKYEHDIIGYNQRIDEIQAGILDVKLRHLAEWTHNRRSRAARYDAALSARGFKTMVQQQDSEAVYHLYVVEVSNREETLAHLNAEGIGCGVHYPVPLHRQPALKGSMPADVALPVTERVADRIMSLPICGELTDAEQDAAIAAFLKVARP